MYFHVEEGPGIFLGPFFGRGRPYGFGEYARKEVEVLSMKTKSRLYVFIVASICAGLFYLNPAHADSLGYSCTVIPPTQELSPAAVVAAGVQCIDTSGSINTPTSSVVYEGSLTLSQVQRLAPQGAAVGISSYKITTAIASGLQLYTNDGATVIPNPLTKNVVSTCSWAPKAPSGSTVATEGYGDYFTLNTTNPTCVSAEAGLPKTLKSFCGGSVVCGNSPAKLITCEASGDGTCPTADQCAKLGAPAGVSPANMPTLVSGAKGSDPYSLLRFPSGNGVCNTNGGGCLAANCTSDSSCTTDACTSAKDHSSVKEVPYPSIGNSGGNSGGSSGGSSGSGTGKEAGGTN
jgi:hypothetical protein